MGKLLKGEKKGNYKQENKILFYAQAPLYVDNGKMPHGYLLGTTNASGQNKNTVHAFHIVG
jgi:hypothetical protein